MIEENNTKYSKGPVMSTFLHCCMDKKTVMNGNIQMFLDCLTLKVEALCFSGTLVAVYHSVWLRILNIQLSYLFLSVLISPVPKNCQT